MRVVESNKEDGSSSDVGPLGNVDEDGKGIPLYGRASNIVLGSVRNESHTINYVL